MVVGAGLFALSVYMLLYVGHLKKVEADWVMNPQHHTTQEATASLLWPKIQAFQNEHKLLWEIAPLTPPYGWNNQPVWFTWIFVQVNWRFLIWLILLGGSGGMARTGLELQKLVDQLNHEDRLEKMRQKRRGGVSAAPGATLIEIRNEIQVQAADTGKWWGLNGAVVGGALAAILSTVVLKWFGIG